LRMLFVQLRIALLGSLASSLASWRRAGGGPGALARPMGAMRRAESHPWGKALGILGAAPLSVFTCFWALALRSGSLGCAIVVHSFWCPGRGPRRGSTNVYPAPPSSRGPGGSDSSAGRQGGSRLASTLIRLRRDT
jgi:hypothetical protein